MCVPNVGEKLTCTKKVQRNLSSYRYSHGIEVNMHRNLTCAEELETKLEKNHAVKFSIKNLHAVKFVR